MNRHTATLGVATTRHPVRRWAVVLALGAVAFLSAGRPVMAQPTAEEKALIEDRINKIVADLISTSTDSKTDKNVKEAVTKFANRDFEGARAHLFAAREDNKLLPPAEVLMAQICFQFNLPDAGRAELEKAVLKNPNDPEPYLIFGDIAFQQRRVTDSEALFLRARDLADKFTEATKRKRNFDIRVNAGMSAVYEAREQWDKALESLRAWIKLDDQSHAAQQRLGRALFRNTKILEGTGENARIRPIFEAFKNAVTLWEAQNPSAKSKEGKPVDPYVAVGRLYQEAEKEENAKAMFDFAIKASPKDIDVLLAYAQWALSTNKLNIAKTQVDEALKVDPNSLEAQLIKGLVARFSKDLKTAETVFEAVHSRQPSNFLAANQLALVLAEQGGKSKIDRALEFAQINMDRFKNNAEAAITLGWVLYTAGRKQEAARYIDAVVQQGNLTGDAAYFVAKILVDNNQKDKAVLLLRESTKIKVPYAHRNDAMLLLGELEKSTPASN